MDYQKIEKLKQWRDEIAQRSGKPAYYILTNKNLEDAFNLNPKFPKELKSLSGWGPKKVEKYGEEVLRIINFSENIINNNSAELSTETKKFDESTLSVAQYINFINLTVQQFNEIKVTGEINDLSGVDRGLAFFDLKDSRDQESTMQCVVFRNNFRYLSHLLEDGLEIVVYGIPSIYPKNGNFKFVVNKIEPIGEGGYKKALERLRKKLLDKGYFDQDRKRRLPEVVKKIGLITSSNGAVINDFKRNLANFGFEVFLKNVYVEGDQAENSIVEAINFFNKQSIKLDVLVLVRGGGSWESLKAFNGERVVEAVVSSKIPIITGIGHESDKTFAGLSSDFDCSTPSITATYLSQSRQEALNEVEDYKDRLISSQKIILESNKKRVIEYLNALNLRVGDVFIRFNKIADKILSLLKDRAHLIDSLLQKNRNFKENLFSKIKFKLESKVEKIEFSSKKLDFLNPRNILKKGYSVVYSSIGKVIDSIDKVKTGETIKVELQDGKIKAKIVNKY